MKNNIRRIVALFCLAAVMTACKKDEIDVNNSIFDTTPEELTGFDKWLDDNFRLTYNIQFRYKYQDIESDLNYNLIPAKADKAAQMAQYIKFLWLDAYVEVVGLDFMRLYSPRIITLVGSSAWKTDSKTAGSAESGLKVTLYNINEFNLSNISKLNEKYFKVLHHEFAHILHHKKMFELTYGNISLVPYVGSSWTSLKDEDVAQGGMVSTYSCSNIYEDFVEVVAYYVTASDEWWADWYALAGEEGTAIIKEKIEFVKKYMNEKWSVDLDKLRSVVRRRLLEAETLELVSNFNN